MNANYDALLNVESFIRQHRNSSSHLEFKGPGAISIDYAKSEQRLHRGYGTVHYELEEMFHV